MCKANSSTWQTWLGCKCPSGLRGTLICGPAAACLISIPHTDLKSFQPYGRWTEPLSIGGEKGKLRVWIKRMMPPQSVDVCWSFSLSQLFNLEPEHHWNFLSFFAIFINTHIDVVLQTTKLSSKKIIIKRQNQKTHALHWVPLNLSV